LAITVLTIPSVTSPLERTKVSLNSEPNVTVFQSDSCVAQSPMGSQLSVFVFGLMVFAKLSERG
jgi:hypothetical protein